ncbi:MAG: SAM-dependent DNA methyltransferase [Anaerolineae bacterium]|nr:SAM-dependent DNA methyltransferase [Anaerolineae bacterium]
MLNSSSQLVQKLWNYCNVLLDDGVSYGDYVEQLTYLLFLKMDEERHLLAEQQGEIYQDPIPPEYRWGSLVVLDGTELEDHYRDLLRALGQGVGLIPIIFRKAQNRIQDPAKLKRLVKLIDDETWTGMNIDVKGEIYEGLLEKNAQDTKSGAGQYFTPRPLIQAIVEVMRPQLGDRIHDPACGTGGFLLAAYDYIEDVYKGRLDRDQRRRLRHEMLSGVEIVDATARLCVMNLYLHNIASDGEISPIVVGDSLKTDPGRRYNMVLTNPPFGKKSSFTVVGEDGAADKNAQVYERSDFWTTTSNKQLNFVQHIRTILDTHGRAAVVLPDNVLFEGGAGETIRRKLLETCDVHTLIRLPTGIFYAQGVKANVLFFDKRPGSAQAQTHALWVYDFRTNIRFTLKQNPLKREDLADFIRCYHSDNRHLRTPTWSPETPDGRWRMFTYEELLARDKVSLDIFWLKDESLEDNANLPAPEVIAAEIMEDLRAALEQFAAIASDLGIED